MGTHRHANVGLGSLNFQPGNRRTATAARFPVDGGQPMQIDTGRRQRAVSLPQSQVGRHGSGARSSSRDRAGSRSGSRLTSLSQSQRMAGDPSSQATAYLLAPSGPQEGADWNDALQTVIRRIDTLERISRQPTWTNHRNN